MNTFELIDNDSGESLASVTGNPGRAKKLLTAEASQLKMKTKSRIYVTVVDNGVERKRLAEPVPAEDFYGERRIDHDPEKYIKIWETF